MTQDKKAPKLRFKGFTDDWEQKKLGDFLKKYVKRVNPEKDNFPLWSLTVEKGLTPKSKRYFRNFLVKKSDYFNLVPPNAFIYNPMNITLGAIALNKTNKNIAISGYYVVLNQSKNYNSIFIDNLLHTYNSINIYKRFSTGTLLEKQRLQYPTFSKLVFYFPNKKEQNKIGKILQSLDRTIKTQQRKLDQLKLLKKGLLQKIFADEDSKVPEIRFKGFNEEWKQCKIQNIASVIGGGTPSTKISNYWDGNINWYSPTEIGKSTYISESHKKITKDGLRHSSAKLLPGNKTILFTSRAGIGDMAIMTTDGTTNQGFQSWVINPDKTNIYFLYSVGNSIKYQALRKASGSTFLEISNKEVKKLNIIIPKKEEQDKIGKLISQIDKNILIQQQKLTHLQQVKKFLLQNMFI